MSRSMGFDFGLGQSTTNFKRKFRWLFSIDKVTEGTNALPPEKGARPSLAFKEIEAQHLNEIAYFPGKPDWKPINLTLYDLKKSNSPVFDWLKKQYDPKKGKWNSGGFKVGAARLELFDGCGKVLERWIFENVWPNNIEWGELDMADSAYVTVDLTLRYDRAYEDDVDGCSGGGPDGGDLAVDNNPGSRPGGQPFGPIPGLA